MSGVQDVDTRTGSARDVSYRWLKSHIAQLPRDNGTFLSEGQIAQAAGTSRTPVREALLRLETEGLVQLVPKKGAYVPPIPDTEVREVMQARGLVEDWCVRHVAGLGPEFAAELERLVAEQERLLDDPVAFIECDRAFHRTIVQNAGNSVLAGFYESLRDRQIRMGLRAVAANENRARTVIEEHRAIVTAIREGRPGPASEALAAHLSSTLTAVKATGPAPWAREAQSGGIA